VEPLIFLLVVYFSLAGAIIGILSGLVPGIHVNTMALILSAAYPLLSSMVGGFLVQVGLSVEHSALLISATIVAASVMHSFLDFIPSVFMGATDDTTALSVLPGHRLLMAGRGLQAIRSAATGSLIGTSSAVLLTVPASLIMGPPLNLYLLLRPFLPVLLSCLLIVLILSEKGANHLRVAVDLRGGRCEKGIVSLEFPVPVDGNNARVSGWLRRDILGRVWVEALHHRWRVLNCGVSPGYYTLNGMWRVDPVTWYGKTWALAVSLLAGALGYTVMNASLPFDNLSGLDLSPLFPLLTGLFGLPTLILSLAHTGIPEQDGEGEPVTNTAFRGVLAGALVGWFPGITSTAGAVVGSLSMRRRSGDVLEDASRFIVTVSAVGSSATVFSLIALTVTGKGRTGAMLALIEVFANDLDLLRLFSSTALPFLLLSVLITSLLGYFLTIRIGRTFMRMVASLPLKKMNAVLIIFIVSLITVFNGIPGLLVAGVATSVGLLPPKVGIARVHLASCLLIPVIIFFLL